MNTKKIALRVLSFLVLFLMIAHPGASQLQIQKYPLMHTPDIHENLIIFSNGGDLWKADISKDVAIAERLTIHDGEESYPKFSPDGSLIAFTGEYDGNSDVYVMDIYGGNIRRVTYHPGADIVVGWHPTKNKIIFRSGRKSFSRFERLFLISPDGTGLEELIMHEAVQGSFSPDGKKIAYNRVAREHRTWKRYQGGLAQDIYMFDFENMKDVKLTDFPGTDRIPMWIGDKIYFSSDEDGVLNIYSIDPVTRKREQLTFHKDYDVRRPSAGGNKIVYELGGSLYVLDVTTKQTKKINVEIRSDFPEIRPYWKKVDDLITDIDISPHGNRALIVARGEIFTVPQKNGPTRNLSQDCGSREKNAVWSPDGKWIAYFSDKSDEYEIYLIDPKGKNAPIRLTSHENGNRHTLRWSPDSKKLAYTDQTLTLYYIDINTKKITRVDRAEFENVDVSMELKPISDFSWSPDSRYIAYSKMNSDLVYQVYIYSLEDRKIHTVSNGLYNDFNPIFSKDGKYLFFISNRRFDPTYCDFEWEMVFKKVAGIYAITLQKDAESLFPLESDEVETSNGEKENNKKEKSGKIRIDFDGINERVEAFPLPRGNYRRLSANADYLFYLDKDEGDFNRFEFRAVRSMDLHAFSFKKRKSHLVLKSMNQYKLSADGKKIVYQKGKNVGIISASEKNSNGNNLNLSDLQIYLEPLKEWTQIFNEAWRMERDYYYEPDMHGINWAKMKEKYGKLLPYVSCRQDVRYLIGELIGELNTSHTYVFGGDIHRKAEQRVSVGMLGADYSLDEKSNRYRFEKIYRVADWTAGVYPPLAKPGIEVKKGDYLLKVNGEDVTGDKNIYYYFQNLAGKQIEIVVNDKPNLIGARSYVVKPIGSERTLRYLDWTEHNRKLVEEKTHGQVGYIHMPDTYLGSSKEFPKFFYAQTRKKGLIIDGRFNGGGLDPDIFLRRLNKKVLAYWTRRYSHDQTIPDMAVRAHMVCITNRQAGSGGDMLPYEFKKKGLGPVIGTRSWGGLVGVSMWISLIDGGGMSAPDYRIYSTEGKWVVENVGVEPDITVDLDPVEVANGYDRQLERAIELLKEKIKEEPLNWPQHEPFPVDDKSKNQ